MPTIILQEKFNASFDTSKIHLTVSGQNAMLNKAVTSLTANDNTISEAIRMNTLTTHSDFHKIHFDSIQTLRGIAALLVLAEHIRFFARGAFGVDIFFVISGFIIMLTTHHSTEYFLRKRLLRIVPFYYLMTLATFGLLLLFPAMFEQSTASPVFLVKSLLFLPFDIGGGILQPLLRIGWTVNCEIFFYLLFALALRISHRYRGLICSLLLILFVGTAALLSGANTWTGVPFPSGNGQPSSFHALLYFWGNPIMLEFILGILCYYFLRLCYSRFCNMPGYLAKIIGVAALLLAAVLIVVLIVTYPSVNVLGYRRLLWRGLPAVLILSGFVLGGFVLTMPRFSVSLGNISFSIYLIHYYPIMLLDRKIFDFSTLTIRSGIGAVLGCFAVIAISAAAWYLIEKKLTALLRCKLLHF